MDIHINFLNNMWVVGITIKKSGNRYNYSCLLNERPTALKVKQLWETDRKHWIRG